MAGGYLDPYGVPLKAPCPACPGRVPMKGQASGLVCPRCRGELRDRQDAAALLNRFKLPPLPERDPARCRSRACGLCGGQMTSHRVQSGQTVEICGTCSGLFLEAGEARLIHQALSQAGTPAAPAPPSAAAAHAAVREPSAAGRSGAPRDEPASASPEPSGIGGAARLLFRLAPVVLVFVAGWHFRGTALHALEAFRAGPATYRTMSDMSSARAALAAEIASDRWPSDVGAFLRESLHDPGAHLDRWGTPYELAGPRSAASLVSCGPDRSCGSADDLVVPLFRRTASTAPDGDASPDRLIRD